MTSNHPPPPPIPAPRRAPYPHIQDLVARTEGLDPKQHASIAKWLDTANVHWTQAKWHREMGLLDGAYLEYLMAFSIVATVIPACQEYPTFRFVIGSKHLRNYETLKTTLTEALNEFEEVKKAIKRNNEAYGIRSALDQLADPKPARANGTAPNGLHNGDGKPLPPPIRAKPGHLVSKSVSPRSNVNVPSSGLESRPFDELQARFQRLGPVRKAPRPMSVPGNSLPASLIPGLPPGKRFPQGPREMPAKLPQLEITAGLPQMPLPTYSPTTSYGSPGGIPPRGSTRAFPFPPQDAIKPELPPDGQLTLSAEGLSSYLKAGAVLPVLLIDVRPREEYDQGRILSRSTICIEPMILREQMSAIDLEEAMVLSPTREHEMFMARDQSELVVYYDQSTLNTDFLDSTKNTQSLRVLKTLYTAIQEFSFSKPLRRPPMLLSGGLDAWIDLFGPQSLIVGDSSAPSGLTTNLYRRSRDVARAPTPLLVERRAVLGSTPPYPPSRGSAPTARIPPTPINIEEEQRWLDQLHKENDPMPYPISRTNSDLALRARKISPLATNTNNSGAPVIRTVEEFFQQYPATPVQQSMSIPPTPDTPSSAMRNANTIIDHPFHVFTDVRNPQFNPPASPVRPLPVAPRKSYGGVSERLTPGVSLAPERPTKASMRSTSGTVSMETTGLKNLGNTCYMNSILQCMSGTIPLARYFRDGSYKKHVNKDNPLGSRGVLAEAFATVIHHLWSGQYSFISPVTFKDVAGRLNETFHSTGQQDAQEFLEFLLDGLHEDLNPNATKSQLRDLTEDDERNRERLPIQVASFHEWERYTHQNSSVVVNWLQGQLSSRLKCLTCSFTSTTYSPFMYLSLPIPTLNARFTLYDCLREFLKEEVLDTENKWNCPYCKKLRRVTKKLTITRLPSILIIHLKRFANQGRWRDKLNTPIDFPVVDLDLTEHVPPPLPADQARGIEPTGETSPPFIYDLYGTVNHYGTLSGGHYTAFVKDPYQKVWNSFDDSKATKMPVEKVVSSNAYVLFWVRKHVM